MQRHLLMLMLVLTATSAVFAQDGNSSDKDTEAIIAREKFFLDAWAEGNPLEYLTVQADDVTYFDDIRASDRIEGKAAMEDYLNTLVGTIGRHHYEIVDPKVQLYGDVGVLTLHYRAWLDDGTEFPVWKATSVYHKSGDEWQIVHAHWSLIKPPTAQP